MKSLIAIVLVCGFVLAAGAAWSTAPDTLRMGFTYAYHVADGKFRVPFYMFNDNAEITGLAMPFRYSSTRGVIVPDSITLAGRMMGATAFELMCDFGCGGGQGNPDSAAVVMIALEHGAPPGRGVIADLWFSGGYPGDLLSLIPIDSIAPYCTFDIYPRDPDGGPVRNRSDLVIVQSQIELICENSYQVQALQWLTFEFFGYGGTAPYEASIVSLVGPNMIYPDPYISGNNPFTFHWRPGSANAGTYTLTLGVSDHTGLYTEKQVTIVVTPSPPDPCGITRGDYTCDDLVDISDLVFMTSWMFQGGPPAMCPGSLLDSRLAVPDTVYIGPDSAFYWGDGKVSVPVWYYNDNDSIDALQLAIHFESTGGSLVPDSITRAGRTYGTNIFELFMDFGYQPAHPDSACAGFVSIQEYLPPGSGVIADMWFSGATPNDTITFSPIDFLPPACRTDCYPKDPEGGPILLPTTVVTGPAGLAVFCGGHFSVTALNQLSFNITAGGGAPPYDLEIASLSGSLPGNPPTLTGSGPWTFTWTPRGNELGDHLLVLRATDGLGAIATRNVRITVNAIPVTQCNYLRGDVNCDAEVNISDLLFLVDYMFDNGPQPDCGR